MVGAAVGTSVSMRLHNARQPLRAAAVQLDFGEYRQRLSVYTVYLATVSSGFRLSACARSGDWRGGWNARTRSRTRKGQGVANTPGLDAGVRA